MQSKVFPHHSKERVLFLTKENKSSQLQVKPSKVYKNRCFGVVFLGAMDFNRMLFPVCTQWKKWSQILFTKHKNCSYSCWPTRRTFLWSCCYEKWCLMKQLARDGAEQREPQQHPPSMGINHVAHSGEMWVLPAWILAKLTTLTLAGPTDELCESTAALLTRASTHHYRPGSSCSSLVKPPSDPRQHRAPSSWSTPSCSLLWAQGLKIRAAAIILSLLSYHWKQTNKKKKLFSVILELP